MGDAWNVVDSLIQHRPPTGKSGYWDYDSIVREPHVVPHWIPKEFNFSDELSRVLETKKCLIPRIMSEGTVQLPIHKLSINTLPRREPYC